MGNSNSQTTSTNFEAYHDRDMLKPKQLNQNRSTINNRTKAPHIKIKRMRGRNAQIKHGNDASCQQNVTPEKLQVPQDQVTLKQEPQQPTTPLSQNTQKTFPDSVERLSLDGRSEDRISPRISMVPNALFGDSTLILSSYDEKHAASASSSDQFAEAHNNKYAADRIRMEESEVQGAEVFAADIIQSGANELQSLAKITKEMELNFSVLERQWQSSSTKNSAGSGAGLMLPMTQNNRTLFSEDEDEYNNEREDGQSSEEASLLHVVPEDDNFSLGDEHNDRDEFSLPMSEDDNLSLGDLDKPLREDELDELDEIIDGNVNDIDDDFEQFWKDVDTWTKIDNDELKEQDEIQANDENDDQSLSSDSMFSQSDCSAYESLGPTSVSEKSSGHHSIGDLSLTPSTAVLIRQRAHRLSLSPNKGSMSTSLKRQRPAKPTATNAFETLPRHLIKNSLLRQAASTLRDERFLTRRITKLGADYASKVHVSDFVSMDDKISKDAEKMEEERTSLEAAMPSTATFADGEDVDSVTIDSFELFEKCILELCGIIQMVGFDVSGVEGLKEGDGEENDNADDGGDVDAEEPPNNAEDIVIAKLEPKIPLSDGGKALYSLGKYCQKADWNGDAMHFYKHALYLYFLDVGVEESRLLDNSDDCDGIFYVHAARSCVHDSSHTHQYLAKIFTKMGDIHGRCGEKNDALRAYRASEVFWRKHIVDLQSEGADNSDEIVAAVEALALSFNRVGGVYTAKGELDAALGVLHDGLEMQMDTLGEDHVEVAKTLHNIGVCHRHNDDWDSALEYYFKAREIFEAHLGREHLDTVRTLHNIGSIYRRKREYAKAMDCFKKVLLVRRRALGDDHPSVSITLVSMAAVLRRCGKKEEANKFYAAAVH